MQNNLPLVSVVIPCYNHQDYVQDCIQSVIDQTYENIELIIIDDGSKDNSVSKIQEMVEACQKRFTRFEFRHRPNKGLSATLNEALEWCKGKYFSAIASDDQMVTDKTLIQVNYLEKYSNCNGVFGGIRIINDKNEIESIRVKKNKKYYFNDIILHNHELPAPTAMLRIDAVRNNGGYPTNLAIEDWYMWLSLTKNEVNYLEYANIIFANYRRHDANISKKYELMINERKKVLNEFRGVVDRNIFNRAYSKIYIAAANDYLCVDRGLSFINYKRYLSHYKWFGKILAFLDVKSIKYIIKFILNRKCFS